MKMGCSRKWRGLSASAWKIPKNDSLKFRELGSRSLQKDPLGSSQKAI
jgi:hypothetical protein